jgi:hypothetical protein
MSERQKLDKIKKQLNYDPSICYDHIKEAKKDEEHKKFLAKRKLAKRNFVRSDSESDAELDF